MQPTDPERRTQQRVIHQLNLELGWQYQGHWQDRHTNHCVEQTLLLAYLQGRGYDKDLSRRAVDQLVSLTNDQSREPYPINKDVYHLLRYGAKVRPGPGKPQVDVHFIDWQHYDLNHFACAEEVSVRGGANTKRPDVVLYVNGIALGLIELKRSVVSVGDGIRQNIGNQRKEFIPHFFATQQLLLAANESQGLRYGTTGTPEKYYLRWKEQDAAGKDQNLLRRELAQLLHPHRFLEIVKDFILFDAGVKKVCRPHQYFGIQAARSRVQGGRGEGGIIWHTQGSGKSLTMVWLAQWLVENITDARVLVITDRDELDKQIVRVFSDAGHAINRASSGADLLHLLNAHQPALICSLVHKFGTQVGEVAEERYVEELRATLPEGFRPKGKLFVFVDECHRTQSGKLHLAMKEAVLPEAIYIGFTGTPLLSKDKQRSIETFGPYIGKPYKFTEAVEDGVVLDLRYEARDIAQRVTNQAGVDRWFEAKTRGLNDIARHQLKQKWGTMRKVLSSKSRLDQIVQDIVLDFATRPRLEEGQGNAMLVAGSVYEACRYYELFRETELAGHCAIVTSYEPAASKISKEDSGEGTTEELKKYEVYLRMLDGKTTDEFEREAKDLFIHQPGRMKLLIVVDKLLTGFDAPSATYLYIDKSMRDHGLFQAICRVNRLDGEGKDYGYIIDYKDLFRSLEKSIDDYTSEAFDAFDSEDVEGLVLDRVALGTQRLADALDACEALVEPSGPRNLDHQLIYFCSNSATAVDETELTQRRRLLYKLTAEASRAYAAIATDLDHPEPLRRQVDYFEKLRQAAQLRSGDRIDMKRYEAGMRRLLDMYVTAEASRKISNLEDFSLIELIVERGIEEAVATLPEELRQSENSVAETIQNNVRREIVEKQSNNSNPDFFHRMSELLEEIIDLRDRRAIDYEEYLARVAELTLRVRGQDSGSASYPQEVQASPRLRALYDNLDQDKILALAMDKQVSYAARDGWRNHVLKRRAVKRAIEKVLDGHTAFDSDRLLAIIENNPDD